MSLDLAAGTVSSVSGSVSAFEYTVQVMDGSGERSVAYCCVTIQDMDFPYLPLQAKQAFVPDVLYRIYYLPVAKTILSVEQLSEISDDLRINTTSGQNSQ